MAESSTTPTEPTVKPVPPETKPAPRKRRRRKTKGEVRLRGVETSFDEPTDWNPLLELVGVGLTQGFMGGTRIRLEDGTVLYAYKHRDTRASIHLTPDGRAFYFDWDGTTVDDGPYDYVETTRELAIYGAFRRFEGTFGYEESRDKPLIDRALDYADNGLRLPVDPRYRVLYEKASSAWREVERLADQVTEAEVRDAHARRAERFAFDDDVRF